MPSPRSLLPALAIMLAAAGPAQAAGAGVGTGQDFELVVINSLPVAIERRALPAKDVAEAIVVVDGKAYAIVRTGADSWKTTGGTPKLRGAKEIAFKDKATHGIIVIDGTPLLREGPPPAPTARTATIVGADGKHFTIVKVGPNAWQSAGGPLPGLYHYRVVTTDESGPAGPDTAPGALNDLPAGPRTNPGPPDNAKRVMQAPGPPDKAKRLMQAPGPPGRSGDPALGGPDVKHQSGPTGDGKFIIKKIPGRDK